MFDNENIGRFDMNLSGRVTEEEFYGTAGTYSAKASWSPVPQVLFKTTYGTSFRAPNLRENFLGGITGFTTDVRSLCRSRRSIRRAGWWLSARPDDTRDPDVLAICRREGRDPTSVGINAAGSNTIGQSSIEVANQGSLDLDPETSKSFTAGVAVTENWGDFDFSFNFNYYSIIVEDLIAELTAQFAINECYLDTDDSRSVFCDQLRYSPADRRLINQAFPTFLNQDKETVKGIDLNANFGYETPFAGDILDLGLNLRANHLIERSTLFINEDEEDFEDDTGEFGFPRWTGRAIGTIGWSDLVLTWETRWIGKTEQQADGVDEFADVFGRGPDGAPAGFTSDTCLGNGSGSYDAATGVFTPDGIVQGDGTFCRDVGYRGRLLRSHHLAALRHQREHPSACRYLEPVRRCSAADRHQRSVRHLEHPDW